MDKENVAYIHNQELFSHRECNYVICKEMDRIGNHYVKWNKSDSERQMSHFFSCII
jgi:hypothetical protein